MLEPVKIFLFSLASFATLFVIAKILGKKQIGELDFIDYTVGISIGSIAAEMATNTAEKPIYNYFISFGVFFLLTLLIDILSTKTNFFKKFLKGTPMVLIENGKINYKQIKKSKLDINDVISLARTKSIFNLDDIAYAIFETDGTLSVMPKDNKRQVVSEDFNLSPQKVSLPQNIIVDGEVSKYSLNYLNKTEEWLFKKIGIKNKKQLKNILLCIYNEQNDSFIIHLKKEK